MNYKSLRKKDVSVSHEMKSKNSKAVLPISNELANILKEWYQINPYEKIICYEDGNYMQPEIMTNTIRQVFKKLGIKGRFHDLRHPYVKPTTKKFLSFFKFEMAISLRAFLCFALLLDIKEGPQFVPFIR